MFGCSKKTTIKYFETLKKQDMISCKTIGKGNRRKHLLTVTNWTIYQEKETENSPPRKPKTPHQGNPNVPSNKNGENGENNISVFFEVFRKEYPGIKGGLKTELDNFQKKNNSEIVHLLLPALEMQKQHRIKCEKQKEFVPPWKNLSTWINKRCWETEFPEGMQTANNESEKTPEEW
jgi:hypothetical protein